MDGEQIPGDPAARRPVKRLVKKRVVISSVFLTLLVLASVPPVLRATLVDGVPVDPAQESDGCSTQVLPGPGGSKLVRCAAVSEQSPDAVWGVLTDYKNFERVFPWLGSFAASREGAGRVHLTGTVDTPLGRLPLDVSMLLESSAERRTASWDQPAGDVEVNRGSWTVRRLAPNRTLLVYRLELSLRHYPDLLVRAFLLDHLPKAVRAILSYRRAPGSLHG